MAKKVTDPKKKKRTKSVKAKTTTPKKPRGAGFKGSSSKTSQAEMNVLQRGMSGKQDVSTETLYDKALVIEQQRLGEQKTSSSQRNKGNYTGLDTATGKRSKSKAKKKTEKDKDKAVKAYHKRNKTPRSTRKAIKRG